MATRNLQQSALTTSVAGKSAVRLWSWLLLALIALRGLVPAGYMIDVSANGLSLVVCGSGIYAAAAQSTAIQGEHHAHHHGDGHHGDGANDSSQALETDHSICPFAVAATGASAPSLPAMLVVGETIIDRLAGRSVLVFSSFGPSRAQQSRAPPSFS